MSGGKTRDQRRASDAWAAIEKIRKRTDRADIVRAARKLPIRIHTAGLGHAVQFVKAKERTEALVPLLSRWVLGKKSGDLPDDLPKAIREGDADSLRRQTAEALAWLQWFNRFAEAEFGEELTTMDEGEEA